jgi:hypothetical protein
MNLLTKEATTPKPYEHQPYPSVRYHRSGKTTVVKDDAESDALAEDKNWSDTPATFTAAAEEPEEAPEAPAAEAPAPKKSTTKKAE